MYEKRMTIHLPNNEKALSSPQTNETNENHA